MAFNRDQFRASLAAELRAEKAAAELTNGELAETLGVTERSVRRYLKGERGVESEELVLFAGAFGRTPGDLIARAMQRMEGN